MVGLIDGMLACEGAGGVGKGVMGVGGVYYCALKRKIIPVAVYCALKRKIEDIRTKQTANLNAFSHIINIISYKLRE